MKVYVVTESWDNHGEYEDYQGNRNAFISAHSTLEKAIDSIKRLILSDENFDSSKLYPPFDTIDFKPEIDSTSYDDKIRYEFPTLYYDGDWDMDQFDVCYQIFETEMD